MYVKGLLWNILKIHACVCVGVCKKGKQRYRRIVSRTLLVESTVIIGPYKTKMITTRLHLDTVKITLHSNKAQVIRISAHIV